ncbi:MAG: protoporphyrinogen oxidase [Acidimicrobiales bacterium]|nr:protoporphyrinogen oxidase [Acidimicrobiales bacterium]
MRAAVVGGGIAGLAAAWELSSQAEVTVVEPERLGGKILTEQFEGRPVECGPDAFITRSPDALRLCAEIGVDDLVAPSVGRTLLWWKGRCRALPEGLVLGVPRHLGPLVRSGLLSPLGLIRVAGDLVLPARAHDGDLSVHQLVAERFGAEVADRLVDPLVGSIHAGPTAELSAAATVPQLLEAASRSRSLLWSLRRQVPATPPATPLFLTPRAGLSTLVGRLLEQLKARGTVFETTPVTGLGAGPGRRWQLEPYGGNAFDVVVLATSPGQAHNILGARGASELESIEGASVAIATLGYPALDLPDGVNGVLVPPSEGLLMTACSFGSAKWPHWANPGRTILRVSTGRAGDTRAFDLSDDQLVDRLADDVGRILGVRASPDTWRINRWPDAMPQYRVGHLERMNRVTAALRRTHPGVALAGSGYHGAGIPACIASGREAAHRALTAMAAPAAGGE